MFLPPPLLLFFSLFQREVQGDDEEGREATGEKRMKRELLLCVRESIARNDPESVRERANSFLLGRFPLLLFLQPLSLSRVSSKGGRGQRHRMKGEGDRRVEERPGKVTVTFSRYVTVNLHGFAYN